MKSIRLMGLVFASVLLVACGGSDNNNTPSNTPASKTVYTISHLSPNAPAVNIYIDDALAYANVDYLQSTGRVSVPRSAQAAALRNGSIKLEIRAILPDRSELSVFGPAQIDLTADSRTDIVAYDTLPVQALVLDAVDNSSAVDQVRVVVLHAAPQAAVADVDIYVTAPGDPIASATPVDLQFGKFTAPLDLMANTDYRIRITGNNSSTVVYDSGTLSFSAGTDLLLAAVQNTTGIGDSPVNLLSVGAAGTGIVYDSKVGAEVRVVHNSADTPPVDILVDGVEALNAVAFPKAKKYADLAAPAGTYNVVVAADADNSIAPINENVTVEQGKSYSVIAVGALNSITDNTLQAVITVDDRRSVATEARIQVIHGSFAVAQNIPVDVYLTDSAVIANAEPVIKGLEYTRSSDLLGVAGGSYFITVTAANDKSTIAFQTASALTLDAGTVYTVIARDPSATEGVGEPLIRATVLAES